MFCQSMTRLSKDIIDNILNLCDIDTRRLFGYYSQLQVPATFAAELSHCFTHHELKDQYGGSRVVLNDYQLVFRWYNWPPEEEIDREFEVRFEPEGRRNYYFNLNQRENIWWADGNFMWPFVD